MKKRHCSPLQAPPAPPAQFHFRPAFAISDAWQFLATLLGVFLTLILVSGCQSFSGPPAMPAGATTDTTQPDTSTKLREGDLVQIHFEGASNLNTTVRIPLDGKISLPFVGQVDALDKTPQELKEVLTKLYEPQLRTTEIRVIAAPSTAVYVSGAVLRPGRVPLDRPMTVLDAIMEAGGPEPTRAKLTDVGVLRKENGKQVRYSVNVKRAIIGKEPSPFYVKPFDIIYVPEKVFNF